MNEPATKPNGVSIPGIGPLADRPRRHGIDVRPRHSGMARVRRVGRIHAIVVAVGCLEEDVADPSEEAMVGAAPMMPAAEPVASEAGEVGERDDNGLQRKLVRIPTGAFTMGSPRSDFDAAIAAAPSDLHRDSCVDDASQSRQTLTTDFG